MSIFILLIYDFFSAHFFLYFIKWISIFFKGSEKLLMAHMNLCGNKESAWKVNSFRLEYGCLRRLHISSFSSFRLLFFPSSSSSWSSLCVCGIKTTTARRKMIYEHDARAEKNFRYFSKIDIQCVYLCGSIFYNQTSLLFRRRRLLWIAKFAHLWNYQKKPYGQKFCLEIIIF